MSRDAVRAAGAGQGFGYGRAVVSFEDGGVVSADQRMTQIITVRTGEAGDGWLCPMSSYPHDL